MAQPESKLSREIMKAIRAEGGFCFKIHGGPTMMAGVPDIIACIPVDNGFGRGRQGLFVGLETKLDTDVSTIQQHRHTQIRNAGGLVIVPHSVAEAMDGLRRGFPRNPRR